MSGEVKVLVGNMNAVYGRLSGRDDKIEFTLTVVQVSLILGLSLAGFLSRVLIDPLFTSQVTLGDIALVASIWMIWVASISLVMVLTRLGGQGGATVVGLCLAAATISLVEFVTPTFLLPVDSYILIQLALALFGLALAFRMVPQILPGGRAARWADRFGSHALPICAVALFVAVTPLGPIAQSTGTYLAAQRAAVEAGRLASAEPVTLRQAVEISATAAAPRQAIEHRAEPAAAPIVPVSADINQDGRAALALLLLAVSNSAGASQASR